MWDIKILIGNGSFLRVEICCIGVIVLMEVSSVYIEG